MIPRPKMWVEPRNRHGWNRGGHQLTQPQLYFISCKFKGGSGTRDTAGGQAHSQGSCEKPGTHGMTPQLLASVCAAGMTQGSPFVSDGGDPWLRGPRLRPQGSPRETFPPPLGYNVASLPTQLLGTCS